MGKEERGVRDGSGSFKGSYQNEHSSEGKRKKAGEDCPESEE